MVAAPIYYKGSRSAGIVGVVYFVPPDDSWGMHPVSIATFL